MARRRRSRRRARPPRRRLQLGRRDVLPRGEDGDGGGGESEWHRGFQVSLEALPPGVELPAAEATLFVGRAVRVLTRPRGAFRGDSLCPSRRRRRRRRRSAMARSDGEFHRAAFEAAVEAIRSTGGGATRSTGGDGRASVGAPRGAAKLPSPRSRRFFPGVFRRGGESVVGAAQARHGRGGHDRAVRAGGAQILRERRPARRQFSSSVSTGEDASAEGSERANFEYASTSPVDAYRVPSFDGWDALELEYRVRGLWVLLTRDALTIQRCTVPFPPDAVAAALDDAWFQLAESGGRVHHHPGRFALENNARRGNDDVTATTRRSRRANARDATCLSW